MGLLCRVVSGQLCLGIWTCQKLELPFEICLGSLKFARDSFLEFELYKTSHTPVNFILHTLNFQRTSDIAPLLGAYVEYPLPTEHSTCAMATGISEKMGGPHVEDSLTPWTQTASSTLSHVCPFCSKSHNSRDLLTFSSITRLVLVCPICGGYGSNQ